MNEIRNNEGQISLAIHSSNSTYVASPRLWIFLVRTQKIYYYTNLQKIIGEQFPSDGVFCIFVVSMGHTKCANNNAQKIAVPASLIC